MKKKCKHVFFRNFPIAGNKWNWKMKKKMNENEYVYFFGYFQWLEQIINIDEKNKIGVQNRLGYCPIVLQRGRILCCNRVIVLQRFRLSGLKSVLQ